MRKIYLVLIMVVVTGLLIGCPSDPTGNGGGTTNPEKPVEQKPHIDYPDWNNNKVDDREEVLTPKDREELFSILDYQKKYEDKGWLAKSIDVSKCSLGEYDSSLSDIATFLFLGRSDYENTHFTDSVIEDWVVAFNQNTSNWDISEVQDMRYTFFSAESFNQNLSAWDVTGKVTTDMFTFSYMEFKPNWHPRGCGCGARWDDPRNTEYLETFGEWDHLDPDNPPGQWIDPDNLN